MCMLNRKSIYWKLQPLRCKSSHLRAVPCGGVVIAAMLMLTTNLSTKSVPYIPPMHEVCTLACMTAYYVPVELRAQAFCKQCPHCRVQKRHALGTHGTCAYACATISYARSGDLYHVWSREWNMLMFWNRGGSFEDMRNTLHNIYHILYVVLYTFILKQI